jgi:hypothetical protein
MDSNPTMRAYVGAAERVPEDVLAGRYVAEVTADDAVVFVIGMRVHRWRKVRSWWPVFRAMPQMLAELGQADAGLLEARTYWSGRTFLVLQYWRSAEELGAYARNPALRHAPAWKAFNGAGAGTGDVGIFHETYVVPRDRIESRYANMPTTGLAAAHGLVPWTAPGRATEADKRMGTRSPASADGPS